MLGTLGNDYGRVWYGDRNYFFFRHASVPQVQGTTTVVKTSLFNKKSIRFFSNFLAIISSLLFCQM